MSRQLIARNSDLSRLRDDGYDIEVRAGHLLCRDVPYLNARRDVKRGVLVMPLDLAGDLTKPPETHVAWFLGDHPCHEDGSEIREIRHQSGRQDLGNGIFADHSFSAKPKDGAYRDFHHKVQTYAGILGGPARRLDSSATAQTFPVVEADEAESVFVYEDTATSRAGIGALNDRLRLPSVAIVGLGGTGSFVLDLVAKCPVGEVHLWDGDRLHQHNAFRGPGAPSIEVLRSKPMKVDYWASEYGRLRRRVVPHPEYVGAANVASLRGMGFVFLCCDASPDKRATVEALLAFGVPFVDVGMGLVVAGGKLRGTLRATTAGADKRDHVLARVSFGDTSVPNDYSTNIQVADLNALNATIAVIKWKKLFGFYSDDEREHSTTYSLAGNELINGDHRE